MTHQGQLLLVSTAQCEAHLHHATMMAEAVDKGRGSAETYNLRSVRFMQHKMFWATPQLKKKQKKKLSPNQQKGNSRAECALTYIFTTPCWSNLLISHNYYKMVQFQVGCAIKSRLWLTAVDSICCLRFWRTAGDFLATCVFFHLSSFNSKMAWQQLRSHIRSELRHWRERRAAVSYY